MGLYNKRDSYLVVGGLAFLHLLAAGLCAFFVYRFLISSYDPGVYLLLAILVGSMVLCDVGLYQAKVFSRFLTRFKADAEGIHCRLGLKKWNVLWNDIHVFGIIGFTPWTGMGIIFLSTDADEKYSRKKCVSISGKRIVFQAEERIWSEISTYMPDDIKVKLRDSVDNKRDCFYRR